MTVLNPPTATADLVRAANRPTAALADTFDREFATTNTILPGASGTLFFVPIYLPAGLSVSSITFFSGSGAGAGMTNQWFCLYTSARGLLATTTDDTTTAWAGNAGKTLNVSPGPIAVPTSGIYLLGKLVAGTTSPNMTGSPTISTQMGLPNVWNGISTGGLTNPASAPTTAAAITVATGVPYAYVS